MGPLPAKLASRIAGATLMALAILGAAATAGAEPKAPSEEENKDILFAKSFVGTFYQGDLELDGWNDLGGGLVSPPIYIRQFQRETDGTYLVVLSREITKATKEAPARLEITDALIVPPPQGGVQFTISCVKGKDEMLRFLGLAKGPEDREWWTDVRRAWEISLETGTLQPTKTKGVRCLPSGTD
jgi:hypothetical protein